jgi:aromatic ring-opening dioxygenase LigB subunit
MLIAAYLLPHPPLILPAIGRGEERRIQATIDAYTRAGREIKDAKPDTVVIVSPHSAVYADYFHVSPGNGARGTMARFGAPELKVTVEYDTAFVAALCGRARQNHFPAGTEGERDASLDHATFIPLVFSGAGSPPSSFKVVRIGVSGLSLRQHAAFGAMIAGAADELGRAFVLIASGDLSHKLKADGPYGYAKEGPVFDAHITGAIRRGAVNEFAASGESKEWGAEKAGECGLRPLAVLGGAFSGQKAQGCLYSYEGPFGVGYAVGKFTIASLL